MSKLSPTTLEFEDSRMFSSKTVFCSLYCNVEKKSNIRKNTERKISFIKISNVTTSRRKFNDV